MKYQVVAVKLFDNSEQVICESSSSKDIGMMVGIYRNSYSAAYRIYKRKKKSYHPDGPSIDTPIEK